MKKFILVSISKTSQYSQVIYIVPGTLQHFIICNIKDFQVWIIKCFCYCWIQMFSTLFQCFCYCCAPMFTMLNRYFRLLPTSLSYQANPKMHFSLINLSEQPKWVGSIRMKKTKKISSCKNTYFSWNFFLPDHLFFWQNSNPFARTHICYLL